MSLAIEYRPKDFNQLIGNKTLIQSLTSVLNKEKPPHAFFLSGPTGCGKTTISRIIAKMVGCVGIDFVEIDSADFTGVDAIRSIRMKAQLKPVQGKARVYLLDEVHKLSNSAMNALLKGVEEAPNHLFYVFATTEPKKVITTLIKRCVQFEVSTLTDDEMFKLLRGVARKERKKLPEAVYEMLIDAAQGHPRNALQELEKIIELPEDEMEEAITKQKDTEKATIDLCRALIGKNPSWNNIAKIIKSLDADPESVRRAVLGYCQAVLLNSGSSNVYTVMDAFRDNFYDTGKPGLTLACYEAING